MSNVERFAMGAQLAISRGVVHLESVLEVLQGLETRVFDEKALVVESKLKFE
jgi:hypothetical protein